MAELVQTSAPGGLTGYTQGWTVADFSSSAFYSELSSSSSGSLPDYVGPVCALEFTGLSKPVANCFSDAFSVLFGHLHSNGWINHMRGLPFDAPSLNAAQPLVVEMELDNNIVNTASECASNPCYTHFIVNNHVLVDAQLGFNYTQYCLVDERGPAFTGFSALCELDQLLEFCFDSSLY